MGKYIIIGLLLLFAASSCTVTKDVTNNSFVQKRKYNNGFFVKNRKSNEIIKKHNEDIVINNSSNKDVEEESITEKSQIELEKITIDKGLLVSKANKILPKSKLKSNIEIPYYFKGIDFIKARKKLRKIDIEPDDDNELKNDPMTIIGFATTIISLLSLVISTSIWMPASYMMWGAFVWSLFSIAFLFGGFILSIVGILRITLYSDTYKGYVLAILGFIIPLITFYIYKVYFWY